MCKNIAKSVAILAKSARTLARATLHKRIIEKLQCL